MPQQCVKGAPLGIALPRQNGLMFAPGDGAFLAKADLGPLLLGEDGPGEPAHVEGEIMNAAEENIGCH